MTDNFYSLFNNPQPQDQANNQDGSGGVAALNAESVATLKQMLERHSNADLEAVRRAKAAQSFKEPFSALAGQKLFAMPHFVLFRPAFHEFLQLRLTLLQFEAQQRNICREANAIERAKKRREAKLKKLMSGKRRFKLRGTRGGGGRGARGAARRASRSSGGSSAGPNSAGGTGATNTSPSTSQAQDPSLQTPTSTATPIATAAITSGQSQPKAKPMPVLSDAQISKLETYFAVRINALTVRITAIPDTPLVPVGPHFGAGGRQLPPGALGPGSSPQQPLSPLLVKFRAWLLKECAHLSAKVARIVEESRKRKAELQLLQQQQHQAAAGGSNSASLSATPETGGSSGGPGSAIGSASTAASSLH